MFALTVKVSFLLHLLPSVAMSLGTAHSTKEVLPFKIQNTTVDGVDLFYREAGDPGKPLVVLLHGFPSSSHQYRHVLPFLAAGGYHILAPDYPGFGFTNVPSSRTYSYTFDSLAHTTSLWLKSLEVKSFAVYIFDYGAPIGLRLATSGDFNIRAIISQNGNVYREGLGPGIQPLLNYGQDASNDTNLDAVTAFLTYEATKGQYTTGSPDPAIIEPESYTLDASLLARPGNNAVQLALFKDYISNVELYPEWQEWLREHQPPVLAIWGNGDPIFIPPGAEAFKSDVKNAKVVLVEGGHFLLETALKIVGEEVMRFLEELEV